MRRIALLGVTAAAALAVASTVGAAQGTLTASPSTVKRGATVTFRGGTCTAGSTAILLSKLFPGHAYGVGALSVPVHSNGRFTARFAVPLSVADANYSVTARCGGGNLGVVAHVRIHGGTYVTLSASPAVVHRGGAVTVSGGVCARRSNAILLSKLFPGHAYGVGSITAKTDARGRFIRTYVVPMSKARGSYTISARCGGGTLGVVAHVRVS